jgi:hypothetical protein
MKDGLLCIQMITKSDFTVVAAARSRPPRQISPGQADNMSIVKAAAFLDSLSVMATIDPVRPSDSAIGSRVMRWRLPRFAMCISFL